MEIQVTFFDIYLFFLQFTLIFYFFFSKIEEHHQRFTDHLLEEIEYFKKLNCIQISEEDFDSDDEYEDEEDEEEEVEEDEEEEVEEDEEDEVEDKVSDVMEVSSNDEK
jgi:hypothetical protein